MSLVDQFWLDEPQILLNKATIFFPIEGMTNDEKLNAIVRLSIYVAIVLYFTRKTLNVFLIPLFIGIITVFIHKGNTVKQDSKELDKLLTDIEKEKDCQMPTEENPYMNTLISDLDHTKEKKEACKLTKEIREKQSELYYKDLYRDVGDLYEKSNSERQFFTMPNTSKFGIKHGDTKEFAQFLFNVDPTCKEDNKECIGSETLFHNDLKRNRNTLTLDELIPL